MARRHLTPIGLLARSTDPAGGAVGDMYYNSLVNKVYAYNGSAWTLAAAQGTQGTVGAQGTQGTQGVQGTLGTTGAQGTQGTQGTVGSQGTQGTAGSTGAQGTTGATGSTVVVLAATTTNITLSGTQTVDGIALVAGDRVLVKDQTASANNGVYVVVSGGPWTRATDSSTSDLLAAEVVSVTRGTINGGSIWTTNFKGTDTLGTTAMSWYPLDTPTQVNWTPTLMLGGM